MAVKLICAYRSQKSERVSIQYLTNTRKVLDPRGEVKYIQGYCENSSTIKTLLPGRIERRFTSMKKAIEFMPVPIEPEDDRSTNDNFRPLVYSNENTADICFTGFKNKDKQELAVLAEKADMLVRSKVVDHLKILCCGNNAGPSKVKSALKVGATILNRQQFEHFIETGELLNE
jgi:hypothetical protein